MTHIDETTFAQFATRFAQIERLVPDPPPLSLDTVVNPRRDIRSLVQAAALLVAVTLLGAALAVAAIGSHPTRPAVTIPPASATAAAVLDAYLSALKAGDCATASQLTVPAFVDPWTETLCGGATRVTAFRIPGAPGRIAPNELVFTTILTVTGTKAGLPSGDVGFGFGLTQEPDGAWRVDHVYSGGPLGPTAPPGATSGTVGTLDVAGGPPGVVHGGEAVVLIVSAPGKPTIQVSTTGGTATRIALEPGDYTITGQYGNAGCSSGTIHVASGSWPTFQLVCSIR